MYLFYKYSMQIIFSNNWRDVIPSFNPAMFG